MIKNIFYVLLISVLLYGCSTATVYHHIKPYGNQYRVAYKDCLSKMDTAGFQKGEGCGDFILFKALDKGVLAITVDLEKVAPVPGYNEFKIGKDSTIEVWLDVYYSDELHPDSVRDTGYCSCIILGEPQKKYRLNAQEGTVAFAISNDRYMLTKFPVVLAKLSDLKFYDPIRKENVFIEEERFWDVIIGWIAG